MLCYQSSSFAKPSRLSHVFCPCYTLCSSADYAMIPKCIFRSHSCLCWVSVARVISTHHTRRCIDSIWGPPLLTNAHCHCHSRRTLTLQTYCYYSEEAETQHSNAGGIYTFSRTSFFVLCTTTVSTFSLTAVFSLQMALSEKFQDAVLGTAVHIQPRHRQTLSWTTRRASWNKEWNIRPHYSGELRLKCSCRVDTVWSSRSMI